ncbi:MAG: phosphate acetyltransferase, partial [Clostridia bacterium]|nr:phosphate acetyltransferase [Clostridia bacterium]
MSIFIDKLKERAKKDIKTIVLAEGEDIRTLKAAETVKKEGYAKVILVGNPDKIKATVAAEGIDIEGIKIVDSENSDKNEEYANAFYELRKAKGVTPEQAAETIKDPSYYAVMMVKQGDADGMVSGAIHSSADT